MGHCLQVNAYRYQQCYLREDPVSGRPESSGAAGGLVRLHNGAGCLLLSAGDNAVDLLYHRAS